ncbi:MAG: hypothetical protein U9O64_05530 [Campylobacterota bacterium]|nr:hypothetical protein [Campylobacterota bacterium]
MNQTQKRLSIINLAISITDIETIQLQILKLGLLKTDEKIQKIIAMLQAENYAQAQGLIISYIETPTDNVVQRSSQDKRHLSANEEQSIEEQSIIDEFHLFVTPQENEERIEIDINDFMRDNRHNSTPKSIERAKRQEPLEIMEEVDINDFLSVAPISKAEHRVENNDFDSLLNIHADDVLTDTINLHKDHTEEDNFFTLPPQNKEANIDEHSISKDTFFDHHVPEAQGQELEPYLQSGEAEEIEENISEKKSPPLTAKRTIQKEPIQENILKEADFLKKDTPLKELSPTSEIGDKNGSTEYKSIPYIAEKLENMINQYPSSHKNPEPFTALTNLLTKISQRSFSEKEIEETLTEVKKLIDAQQFSQATQLLLLAAATPSPFAQLILARELYKGVLFTQDIPQAFTILNRLTMDDYPEALCDLGQFFEYGIGTKKDQKRAQELYKESMNLGIKRAGVHYARMKKSRKRFFGS